VIADINVVNRNKKRKINIRSIKGIARFVIKKVYRKRKKINLNIIFASDNYVKKLNRMYKGKNRLTDVLCFCMPEGSDIFISSDRVFINSKRFGLSIKHETYLYVVHGILHMLGFRDDTSARRKQMGKLQVRLLNEFISG